jgi:hypothetical protein
LYYAPPFGTPSNFLFLVELSKDTNPCDFSVSTDARNEYCSTDSPYFESKHVVSAKIGGNNTYASGLGGAVLPYQSSVNWLLNTNPHPSNNIYYDGFRTLSTNVAESGTYKLTVRQGVCEKSVEKNVLVSSSFNPPAPVLTANHNPICGGDSTTLTASGCAGSISWNSVSFDDRNGNTAKVYPSISQEYTASCYVSNSQYGNCRSTNSTPFTVNVITLPEVISLAGPSPLNATYRAERINSQQNVVINGAVDYKSKNTIVLNPGFSTQGNAIFNAKIVSSCVE